MTRDDIYEHLAQVYLGKKSKRETKRKHQFNAWLIINIVITFVIFASTFYGLCAFLAHHGDAIQTKVIYSLNNGPIRITYNLGYPYPSVKSFSLNVSGVNVSKYKALQFSARGTEEGYPGIVRIEVKTARGEVSSVLTENIELDWRDFHIPFKDFEQITDKSSINEVSFILESWNTHKDKGILLIDNICFSG